MLDTSSATEDSSLSPILISASLIRKMVLLPSDVAASKQLGGVSIFSSLLNSLIPFLMYLIATLSTSDGVGKIYVQRMRDPPVTSLPNEVRDANSTFKAPLFLL